jgi:hypothetical protein
MPHGGEYPDTMLQAIKLIDAEGRSCIYVPITQNGKVVDSQKMPPTETGALSEAAPLIAVLASCRNIAWLNPLNSLIFYCP